MRLTFLLLPIHPTQVSRLLRSSAVVVAAEVEVGVALAEVDWGKGGEGEGDLAASAAVAAGTDEAVAVAEEPEEGVETAPEVGIELAAGSSAAAELGRSPGKPWPETTPIESSRSSKTQGKRQRSFRKPPEYV